jgi:predicted dehydrogenase
MEESNRIIRMGMVGGGPGAFIGPVHRRAAELDGKIRLVAGAFSSDPAKSKIAGREFGLSPERAYHSFEEMFEQERGRPDPIDFVAIVTPNHLHFPIARAALNAGFHVLSDKPATASLAEALSLRQDVVRSGLLYGLTFTYSAYPMIRDARERCLRGDFGNIRKVVAEYSQGWLRSRIEAEGSKQAAWRTDPRQAGVGGCVGDIGVHAFHLLEFVTGSRVVELCSDVSALVPGRQLDDDCNVLLRLENGGRGVLFASQIAVGDRNGLRLRVYGEKGGLDWAQESPNQLTLNWGDRSTEILHAGANAMDLTASSRGLVRLPLGHPEGYIEAFANLYADFAAAVRGRAIGDLEVQTHSSLSIDNGVRSMAFIELAVNSSGKGWTTFPAEH